MTTGRTIERRVEFYNPVGISAYLRYSLSDDVLDSPAHC